MMVWATIVVEELHGHWSAWFQNEPATGFGGEWPSQAIDRLLDANNREIYDTDQMHPIEEATRDGHLEFLIPFRGRVRIPVPSRN
jgi:hypothetical protein